MDTQARGPADLDRAVLDIGLEWLTQYARFLRRSPDLVSGLLERTAEFELVPIPRRLLDELAVPGLVGSGQLGLDDVEGGPLADLDLLLRSAGERPAPDDAVDVVREFAAAIGAADASAAAALLAESFVDEDGRSRADVEADLARLLLRTVDREWHGAGVVPVRVSPGECVVRLHGSWRAGLSGGGADPAVVEEVCLECIVGREPDGGWRIRGVRSA